MVMHQKESASMFSLTLDSRSENSKLTLVTSSSTKSLTKNIIEDSIKVKNLKENHEERSDEVVNTLDIARGRVPAHHGRYTRIEAVKHYRVTTTMFSQHPFSTDC